MDKEMILNLSALELGLAIKAGQTTVVEAVEAVLARIAEREPALHAFITVDEAGALAEAEKIQAQIEAGKLTGPLAGVPFAVKDNLCTRGLKTTCGSKMLEHFVPTYTATAVEKLTAAGAILIGKTNMDEFAFGSTTETSYFGPTHNPVKADYVPGGSSGGSAAAVAAGECFFALGSDTGGSVRQPAAHCGVAGMKPTYGSVSRYGLVAYASSLDQIGPLCRNSEDLEAVLSVIARPDERDSTCVGLKKEEGRVNSLQGLRVGVAMDATREIDGEISGAMQRLCKTLREQGAEVEPFAFAYLDYLVPAYYTIASAEASSNLERFDGVKYGFRDRTAGNLHEMYKKSRAAGFGPEVKRRLMLGSFVLSAGFYDAYYLKALKVKTLLIEETERMLQRYDCILTPVTATTAPKLGESLGEPMKMYLSDRYTVLANLTGLPALSLPCGLSADGLPMGLQFLGRPFEDYGLIQMARLLEKGGRA